VVGGAFCAEAGGARNAMHDATTIRANLARSAQIDRMQVASNVSTIALASFSFFGVPRLALPHVAPDNGLQIASLLS
jgi:hypothetical protein